MMNRVANMNEAELKNVAGGVRAIDTPRFTYIHKGCGGEIQSNLFEDNVCEKCGEAHFFMWNFDYESVRA